MTMHGLSYYAFNDTVNTSKNKCSRESDERPLVVNCAGKLNQMYRFTTDNVDGRLDYYLLYVIKGNLIFENNGEEMLCTSGSFVLYPPRFRYIYRHTDDKELDYVWIHFTGSDVPHILKKYGLEMFPTVNVIKHDEGIYSRFRNLFNGFIKQDRFRDDELSVLLQRLLISLGRRLSDDGENSLQRKNSVTFINSHYNREIRIPELAKMESLSVSRYNSVFRKIYGTSPVEYITRMRISSACELLGGTDLSIKEIALITGYSDPHFFSRVFKANVGISPSEYRKVN